MEQIKQYEYVDLGLPSGLKWAKCNIGAETETDYGDYFMWGSTKPNAKTTCNWAKNPFNNGSSIYNEDYFNAHKSEWLDDKNNLKPEYDAAVQIMGGDWRMPTRDEIQELLDNTDNEWDTINGVNGWKFTSKTDISKYIFIPASGFYSGFSFNNQGNFGSVWASSLEDGYPFNALDLYFISDYIDADYGNYRCYGLPVRGVMEKKIK